MVGRARRTCSSAIAFLESGCGVWYVREAFVEYGIPTINHYTQQLFWYRSAYLGLYSDQNRCWWYSTESFGSIATEHNKVSPALLFSFTVLNDRLH